MLSPRADRLHVVTRGRQAACVTHRQLTGLRSQQCQQGSVRQLQHTYCCRQAPAGAASPAKLYITAEVNRQAVHCESGTAATMQRAQRSPETKGKQTFMVLLAHMHHTASRCCALHQHVQKPSCYSRSHSLSTSCSRVDKPSGAKQ